MSIRNGVWMALAPVVALGLVASAAGEGGNARLATYDKDGQTYFALSLMPNMPSDPAQKKEVVVLVDTSASQVGAYRAEQMAALDGLLASLTPEDRVHLLAVDMKAVPMSDGFVAPSGPAMQAALAKLRGRTPLGATDLEAGLRAAAAALASSEAARSVIYLGDAMSKANALTESSLSKLVEDLRASRVAVMGYAVGQERNGQLLAALANHTGGVAVLTDGMQQLGARAGQVLAAAVRGSVIWPAEAKLADNVAASYPRQMPPLRTDRDTILVGTLAKPATVEVQISGTMNGKPVSLSWQAAPEKPSEDFAFLPKLVELAQADGGISLPTAGSAGLREAGLVMLHSAEQLTKLGHQALATGNFEGAEKVAEAALARDPSNPEATALKAAAHKAAVTGKVPAAGEADLKLAGFAGDKPAGSLLEEVLAEQPGFLNKVEEERAVMAGRFRAEVEKNLADARRTMASDPAQAEQDLKLVLQSIESSIELDPEVRSQLRQQVETAIREARRRTTEVEERHARAEEQAAIAQELQRLNQSLVVREQQLKQLMDRFDSLLDEGRYQTAQADVAPEVHRLTPYSSLDQSVAEGGQMMQMIYDNDTVWRAKERNYLLAMYQVELSGVPFPDEPPIIYPPAEQWEDLTLRRQKYKQVDLGRPGGSEQRIFEELNKSTDVEFIETPLKDGVAYLQDLHKIPIVLVTKKLEEAGVNPDTPVTKTLHGISLRSALRLILKELELTYVVREEVLQITTPEDAESQLITKVYPVGDLVVPVSAGNNLFGLGGMMGGGMMGGMGGGMGGMGMGGGMMGGGMGGMGGGMMGGMGGGGGGFFAVEDELTLGTKAPAAGQPTAAPQPLAAPPAANAPPAAAKPVKPADPITLQPAAGESLADAWDRYLAAEEKRVTAANDPRAETAGVLARLRETVRQQMRAKQYGDVPVVIQAALRHSFLEPWMYEAMVLAMQAEGKQDEELERALLSAVDFAETEDQILAAAMYMERIGLFPRALKLYQQLGTANPTRPEPFVRGLAVAQRLDDLAAIQWACVGILSHAWTGDTQAIGENALRVGKATYERLLAAGKKEEAQQFDAAVRRAAERDCVVVVSWTGDADIDVVVEEPSGTVVSQRQPRSTSGGVHLGDVSAAAGKVSADGFSEVYVCPQGFDGEYRVLIKDVWGRPTSGKVTVDVYTHYGSERQTMKRGQVPLGEKNAVVVFELQEGRRKDPLPEVAVANVAKVQNAVNRSILAQQLAQANNGSVGQDFANSLPFFPGFFRRGAVGYRPVITQLPEGANFSTIAVISADRRYVRVSPSPTFSQVTDVSTFNFVTGQGQNQGNQGGTGGFGSGIGGGGGFF